MIINDFLSMRWYLFFFFFSKIAGTVCFYGVALFGSVI